jgi:hypothetical protein
MIESNIEIILIVTGLVTTSMWLQAVAPARMLKTMNGLSLTDPVALFFARGLGLAIGSLGVLILCAAADPALRVPVLSVAIVGKTGFVASILATDRQIGPGFRLTAGFDSICVAIYVGYLLGV